MAVIRKRVDIGNVIYLDELTKKHAQRWRRGLKEEKEERYWMKWSQSKTNKNHEDFLKISPSFTYTARQCKWVAGYIHHREIAESNCLSHIEQKIRVWFKERFTCNKIQKKTLNISKAKFWLTVALQIPYYGQSSHAAKQKSFFEKAS